MKKKILLKIIALISALCLISVIIIASNAFVGNPVSAFYANKAIKNYVAEKYSHMDLVVEKARYNFIDTGYRAIVKSKTSNDTHFAIYYRGGRIRGDDYEANVLGKLNTLIRLQNEYSQLVTPILSNALIVDHLTTRVQIEKTEYEKPTEAIELDMQLDKNLPIQMKITITTALQDNSLNNIAAVLKNAHKILVENDLNFATYDISSESNGVIVIVSNVSASDIEGGNLEQLFEDAQKNGDNKENNDDSFQGIRVFIKQP